MRSDVGRAYDEIRAELAGVASEVLPDTCWLIVPNESERSNVPCKFIGGSGNVDGASYTIRFAWGSPAVVGATAIIDAITGRPQLTLQLDGPVDSSTDLWQEWRATSAPVFGRANVGL